MQVDDTDVGLRAQASLPHARLPRAPFLRSGSATSVRKNIFAPVGLSHRPQGTGLDELCQPAARRPFGHAQLPGQLRRGDGPALVKKGF